MATAQNVLHQLNGVSDDIKSYVTACAKYAPDVKEFTTRIVLTGDPDVGTLVDAPTALQGNDGNPLPKQFDDCVRGQLQTLELPPMKTGDGFTVDFNIAL